MIFLLGRLICCTRQELDKRRESRASPWRSCALAPLLHHPAHRGIAATAKQAQRCFSFSASTGRFSAWASPLSSAPSGLGRRKADQGSWEQAAGRRAQQRFGTALKEWEKYLKSLIWSMLRNNLQVLFQVTLCFFPPYRRWTQMLFLSLFWNCSLSPFFSPLFRRKTNRSISNGNVGY